MDSKKSIIVIGSPRKNGNSALLAERTEAGIRDAGDAVKSFFLHDMDIGPCTACDSCQQSADAGCTVIDDMQKLYPLLKEAGSLVIASPIYWFTISAQTKLFMDRCYAIATEEKNNFKGKKIGIILVYGDTDPYASGAINAIRMFQDAYRFTGSEIVDIVYGSADRAGDIAENKTLLEKAYSMGSKLIG
jgi:multimeric flavodoxin WrbA